VRILYVAIDQTVPGTTGGSVHVAAVAEGLAALEHDVHVLAGRGDRPFPSGPVCWHALRPPLGARQLRMLRARKVLALAQAIGPDVIIERYYNFGGEGLLAAKQLGALSVLEVNAPVVDYDGSPKRLLDRALVVEPMRRWREWQCRAADLIVTPSRAIVPSSVPRERIVEIEWGADTTMFHPGAPGAAPFIRRPGSSVAVFAGAFRRWHGAIHLVDAIRRLHARGRRDIVAVLVGDGPELPRARKAAGDLDGVVFTGAVIHEQMPACLAAADIGVAPFDVSAHAPLALDFYWSPLKIFEYMATGLPVVAPDIARLRHIVTHEREGILYDASDPDGLALALERLTERAPDVAGPGSRGSNGGSYRASLGAAARDRVVRQFGWDVHCRRLDEAIRRVRQRTTCGS
jgi:glycosyltransferase involved in cell wall biosynthesis